MRNVEGILAQLALTLTNAEYALCLKIADVAKSDAARWHDDKSRIFRKAISEREAHGIPHGEHLVQAEWHERCARQMREEMP